MAVCIVVFVFTGHCPFGSSCRFSHLTDDLRAQLQTQGTRVHFTKQTTAVQLRDELTTYLVHVHVHVRHTYLSSYSTVHAELPVCTHVSFLHVCVLCYMTVKFEIF